MTLYRFSQTQFDEISNAFSNPDTAYPGQGLIPTAARYKKIHEILQNPDEFGLIAEVRHRNRV